ncbi:MAG: Transcriptional regulator, LacI family [Oscillospiraceae bacterium]
MSVTIKDIAKRANVSHTTVSRALRNSPLIGEKTRKRIQELAKEMNYVPNMSAKGLVTVRSYNIGLFFTSMFIGTSSDFIFTMIRGISEQISEPYNVVINGLDKMHNRFSVNANNYDGIILVSQSKNDDAFIAHVKQEKIPLVVLNRSPQDEEISCLYCDERMGIKSTVSYLADHGHRKIAFVKGIEGSSSTERRFAGFLDGMKICGLSPEDCPVVQGDYTAKSGYPAMKQILAMNRGVTAVIFTSDAMAYGAMRAIAETGLSVPKDISIIGFDDGDYANNMYPRLTSIARPLELMAETGAKLLLDKIEQKDTETKRICYPVSLSIKDSVKSLK